jgi:hypothetical protein
VDLLVRVLPFILFDFRKAPQGKMFSKDTDCASLKQQSRKK